MIIDKNKEVLLKTIDIKKIFMGNVVIENVNFALHKGECLALVGENGAGKSTLMKILSGVYQEDEGDIYIKGNKINISTPKLAQELGISIIHQEFNLISELTVAENIFLGRELTKGLLISEKYIYNETKKLLDYIDLQISPNRLVEGLTVAEKQIIEILKAISVNSEIIIMDEPTASLNTNEAEKLFTVIKRFKKEGKGIIYISHHMEEFRDIADRIAVLRDGSLVKELDNEASVEVIVEHMVGRKIDNVYPTKNEKIGEVLFKAHNLSGLKGIKNISFSAREGEVVGISGLMGSGQLSLAKMLYGIYGITEGHIEIKGKKHKKVTPNKSLKNGIGFVSEDRKEEGLILMMSIESNVTISNLSEVLNNFRLINDKKSISITKDYIKKVGIKANSPLQEAVFLSGGNQQKVVFSKVLFSDPDIVILCEPTRGVDIGAKFEIYRLINEFVNQKKGVILISSELPEIIGLSHKVLVMNEGEIVKEMSHENITQEEIMYYATGNA